jgi:hypothetical protein
MRKEAMDAREVIFQQLLEDAQTNNAGDLTWLLLLL